MFIDLTMPLNETTPAYPGDPKVRIEPAGQLDDDGYLDHTLHMSTHSGTHIDAPAHMFKDGKLLSSFEPKSFIGKGIVIDVSQDFSLATVQRVTIEPGAIVLLYTGMSENYSAPDYYDTSPSVPEDVAKYFIEKKIKMVGVDTESVDSMPYSIHQKLLKADILIIENLINLRELLNTAFTVFALPLRLDTEAAPARVIAQLAVPAP